MNRKPSKPLQRLVVATCAAFGAHMAHGDVVTNVLPSGPLTASATWFDTAAGQTPAAATGTLGNAPVPVTINALGNSASTYTFQNTIQAPNGSFAGFQVQDSAQGQTDSIGFLDSYVVQIPSGMTNASVFSLSLSSTLGLSDLTMRLYDYSSANGYQVNKTGAVTNAQLVDNWSWSNNPTANDPVANSTLNIGTLQQGTYVLEVGGLETGSTSGTYSGQLNITPVPLPAAAWLLVTGMGALGAFRRSRSF